MLTLRWLAIVPAAALGYLFGAVVAICTYMIGEWTCPIQYVISDTCSAPWSDLLISAAFAMGASVAAFSIVLFSAATAPRARASVANSALILGTAAAVFLAIEPLLDSVSNEGFGWWGTATWIVCALMAIMAGFLARYVVARVQWSPQSKVQEVARGSEARPGSRKP